VPWVSGNGYGARVRVVVLGAGFGGLEITSRLSATVGDALDLTLIDRSDRFVFGFSKLDVMFGRTAASEVEHRYADIVKPGVRFLQTAIRDIDPVAKLVTTDDGEIEADIIVVALGADLQPEATPGLVEAGQDFYSVASAFAVRDVLTAFDGGRVVIGVTSTPFKCPPAPSETALLMHDLLSERGLLDRSSVSLVMPLPVPIPPSPEASDAILAAFAERGIDFHPNRLVRALDPERQVAVFSDGDEIPFDLFLGVPRHVAPEVVVRAGMTTDGWITVDPRTLQTAYEDVYAVGDVTSIGTPKAGVFAEGQGAVVADAIAARIRGEEPPAGYDGRGVCYMQFGWDSVATVDVTFLAGERPVGTLVGPSEDLVADKQRFGASRIARWFGPA